LGPPKLTSVVKVCAGEATAIAQQNTKRMENIFDRRRVRIVPSFRSRVNTKVNGPAFRRVLSFATLEQGNEPASITCACFAANGDFADVPI
jgi:hypothetical protein